MGGAYEYFCACAELLGACAAFSFHKVERKGFHTHSCCPPRVGIVYLAVGGRLFCQRRDFGIMRCMSKCVVNRSTRVYTVLLGGITFGFALSTVIQNLSFSEFGKSAGWTADYPSAVVRGGRASFSNLPAVAQQQPDEEQIDIGGYYDYERLVLLQEEKEEQKEGEERKELVSPSQQQQIASDALSDKMKRREYVKEGGRDATCEKRWKETGSRTS